VLEVSALPAQRLGEFGVVPDFRVFQFPVDFFEAVTLVSVVKDTPGARLYGSGGLLTGRSVDWFPRGIPSLMKRSILPYSHDRGVAYPVAFCNFLQVSYTTDTQSGNDAPWLSFFEGM